jgi:hypothetical protein
MVTLQRLPLTSILLADIGSKVFFEEHPTPANPGRRKEPRGGALPKCRGVQLQEAGGFGEVECAHSRRTGVVA